MTVEAQTLVLQELLLRKCEGHRLQISEKAEIGRALNIYRHTCSRLWKCAVECFEENGGVYDVTSRKGEMCGRKKGL